MKANPGLARKVVRVFTSSPIRGRGKSENGAYDHLESHHAKELNKKTSTNDIQSPMHRIVVTLRVGSGARVGERATHLPVSLATVGYFAWTDADGLPPRLPRLCLIAVKSACSTDMLRKGQCDSIDLLATKQPTAAFCALTHSHKTRPPLETSKTS